MFNISKIKPKFTISPVKGQRSDCGWIKYQSILVISYNWELTDSTSICIKSIESKYTCIQNACVNPAYGLSGIILCTRTANERQPYNVMSFLNGWEHAQIDLRIFRDNYITRMISWLLMTWLIRPSTIKVLTKSKFESSMTKDFDQPPVLSHYCELIKTLKISLLSC